MELAVVMVIGGGVPVRVGYDDAIGENGQSVLDDRSASSEHHMTTGSKAHLHIHTHAERNTHETTVHVFQSNYRINDKIFVSN